MVTTLGLSSIVGFILEAGIIGAIVTFCFERLGKKIDRREADRVEESYLCTSMLKALGHLAEATAIAQQEGRCNGEMTTALGYYSKVKDELNDFVTRKSAERTHAR